MNNLNRYNQKLLAIIGTIIIGAAGVLLIIGIGGFIISLTDFSTIEEDGIRVTNQSSGSNDSSEFVRTQEVTFNTPFQLDTSQAKYLITVGQVNLKKDEDVSFESKGSINFSSGKYSYRSDYGLFNNFIFVDYSNGLTKKLFEKRVAITNWAYLKNDSIEVLLFKGTSTDDNLDNQMNSCDYQSLFAYYINDQELKQYDFKDKTVLSFDPMKKTDLVSIQLGIDRDKDFYFENKSEPQIIHALNVRTQNLEKIISDEIKDKIQSIIDGR